MNNNKMNNQAINQIIKDVEEMKVRTIVGVFRKLEEENKLLLKENKELGIKLYHKTKLKGKTKALFEENKELKKEIKELKGELESAPTRAGINKFLVEIIQSNQSYSKLLDEYNDEVCKLHNIRHYLENAEWEIPQEFREFLDDEIHMTF